MLPAPGDKALHNIPMHPIVISLSLLGYALIFQPGHALPREPRENQGFRAPVGEPVDGSEVHFARFYSPALGVHKGYMLYLPRSYAREPSRRFPVAYYLHGHGQDETAWVGDGRIDAVMDSVVADGGPELIIVMPDGDDGRYTTWAVPVGYEACAKDTRRHWADEAPSAYCVKTPRYDEYVARDLVAHIDSSYRTLPSRRHRGIAGLSMGGYGAVTLALRYPDVFSAAATHSGSVSPFYVGPHPYTEPARYTTSLDSLMRRFGPEAAAIFGPNTSTWRARDPAHLAELLLRSPRRADLMPALYVDVGRKDHLVDPNRDFHAKLRALGIRHEYRETDGGHDWPYWQRNVRESLEWLVSRLTR
jgi:S-formylglutathione hydrolase FrmB